jgi:putative glutamine amidotransferase
VIAVVALRLSIDTPFGEQPAAVVRGEYLSCLDAAGASPVILAPGTRVPAAVMDRLTGLVLVGGGDVAPERFGGRQAARDIDVDRDELEIDMVHHCRERRIPVLAVCRGHQVLNVALGGTLATVDEHVQDEPLAKPSHEVAVASGSRLAGSLDQEQLAVNSFHRWAVDAPAEGVEVTARAPDGVVEGIEWAADDWFAVGIQWHAELLTAPHAHSLFTAFVKATEDR